MFGSTPGFASFSVDDIDAAERFYKDDLGLSTERTPEGLALTLSDGGKIFLYPKPDHEPASFTVLNFVVDDIDRAVDELTARGIALERYDMPSIPQDAKGIFRGRSSGNGPDVAWFRDKSGNILSVLEK